MSILTTQITTGATAQKLCAGRSSRRGLIIKNHDATNAVLIGNSAVAATGVTNGGLQLAAGATLQLTDFNASIQQDEFWAVAAAGTPIVSVLEHI